MVREVFTNIFEKASPDDPLVLAMKDTDTFVKVDEGEQDFSGSGDDGDTPPPSARPVEEVKPAQPAEEKKTFKGFFKRLFKGD